MRFPALKALLCTLPLLAAVPAWADDCPPAKLEKLFTTVLYREATADVKAQAAVAAIVFNRLESGIWGNTLCSVMTWRRQLQHTMKHGHKVDPEKMNAAKNNAPVFLRERGNPTLAAGTFRQLDGYLYFNNKGGPRPTPGLSDPITIGDNTFYRKRDHAAR